MKAWHFVGDTLRDGRPIPDDGVKLVHEGKLEMCVSGLHASLEPFDALRYSPGNFLCYVECEGEIIYGNDKVDCTERTIIKRMDVESLLWKFAREQALSVIHLWDAPNVVKEYLETGNEGLRAAAWSAARAAAKYAAKDAARDAARAAAKYAARDAARAAAKYAAKDAARDAAKYAAKDAARDAARAAAWAAAKDAAWAAASAAARDAARYKFNGMMKEAFNL